MGQYWMPVNLTKREYINPHKLGSGLKLREQIWNAGVGQALVILTAAMPERRGGGDFEPAPIIGRWAGDRIAIVGDYAERSDLPDEDKADEIYTLCWASDPAFADSSEKPFTDVTDEVCAVIERELDGKFVGDGWRKFKPNDTKAF